MGPDFYLQPKGRGKEGPVKRGFQAALSKKARRLVPSDGVGKARHPV